jgi:hypothetical protein
MDLCRLHVIVTVLMKLVMLYKVSLYKRAVLLAVVAVDTRCEMPFTAYHVSQIVITRVSFQPPTSSAIGASNLRQHAWADARGVIGKGKIGV